MMDMVSIIFCRYSYLPNALSVQLDIPSEGLETLVRICHHFVVVARNQPLHWMPDHDEFEEMLFGEFKLMIAL